MDRIRDKAKRIIYGEDEFETRFHFVRAFESEIDTFLDRIATAVDAFENLAKYATDNERRAYSATFVWNALNDLTLSMRLLLSGYQVPSGALMRQHAESIAMSLLVSDPSSIRDLSKLDQFPVHKSLEMVGQKKVSARLGMDRTGWMRFQETSRTYDSLSHPSALALGAGSMDFESGTLLIGGAFDREKVGSYEKEILLRISAVERVIDTEDHLAKQWSGI